jgi:RNA polymerase sigma-70 factor, ECF subfamily
VFHCCPSSFALAVSESKMESDIVTDEQLVVRARDGDLSAFDELVIRHQGMISRCLFRFCPHQSDLEDLVQDSFIKAYRKLHLWKPTAPFENWLRRIAYNTGHDYFRRSKRTPTSLSALGEESNELLLGRIEDRSNIQEDYQITEQVQQLLSELPADDRLLLTMHYLEERPLAEVAEVTGWTLSKTKVKSFRAKNKLRKLLNRYDISE